MKRLGRWLFNLAASRQRHAGRTALISMAMCLSIAVLWPRIQHGVAFDGSFGWNNFERHHLLFITVTEIHAYAGPVVVFAVADWLAWLSIVATLALPLHWVINNERRIRRRQLRSSGRCAECGYDLRATPDRCPECGAVPDAAETRRT